MPLYECKGNIDHNFVSYKKGEVVELPEGEKSDLFVLCYPAAPPAVEVVAAPVVADEPAVEEAPVPVEDTEPGKKKRGKKASWFGSDEPKDG
jgi:hypothetical protein